jgi:thiol-disulfide isomerase/thioredoxin
MKKFVKLVPFFAFVFFLARPVYSQVVLMESPLFEDVKKQARQVGKNVILVGCTEWCAPCKTLKNEHFKDSAISSYINSKFVVAFYDMERGTGITIGQKYGIKEYPTLIILNSAGEMLGRIGGLFREIQDLHKALSKFESVPKSPFAGISASVNMKFPKFYSRYFENLKKNPIEDSVVNSYLEKQQDLFSEVNWRVMTVGTISKRFEDFIYNNYNKYFSLYNQEVKQRMYKVIRRKVNDAISKKDEIAFSAIKQFMIDKDYVKISISEYVLAFYGRTGLNWPLYMKEAENYIVNHKGSVGLIVEDTYDKDVPADLMLKLAIWIDEELKQDKSSWNYIYKGLFYEKQKNIASAERMYNAAVDVAEGDYKSAYQGHIKNMRQKVHINQQQ